MTPRNFFSRRTLLRLPAAALLGAAFGVAAQANYPDRIIKMIVPFPAGSALDVLARVIAQPLGAELGQQVVLENRTGATGHIAGEFVARAAPDGYTLLFTASSTQAVSPHLMRLHYKPLEDLVPVSLAGTVNNVLVVHKDLPVRNVAELVAYARAHPGQLSYGSYGLGSNLHLAGEMLCMMGDLQMTHVPYSAAQLVPDLLAGRIQVQVANIPEVEQHVKSGTLRAIAVTSPTSIPEFPGLPPVADTLPGYAVGAWAMVMAPARTPPDILAKINTAMQRALAKPEVREAFAKQRFQASGLGLAQSREFLLVESARWERVVREARVPMLN